MLSTCIQTLGSFYRWHTRRAALYIGTIVFLFDIGTGRTVKAFSILFFLLLQSAFATAAGNQTIESYSEAKWLLYNRIYYDHRVTLYCDAEYDQDRNVFLPEGFEVPDHFDRAYRAETEHIVAAENLGRAFSEWREGAPQCVNSRGRAFKGRKCAERNIEFRLMEADLHNLAPAIGSVNAKRSNYRFGMLPNVEPTFGICPMKIRGRVAEPPDSAKGIVARTHLYMSDAYPARFRLSRAQRQLFEAWDRQFPPDDWECERERRIARIQGNKNEITASQCH